MKPIFRFLKYIFIFFVVSTIAGSVIGAALFIHFSAGLPNIITTQDYRPNVVTQILGKGDVVIGEYYEERRYVLPPDQVPDLVTKAFVSAEDDRFFEHHGIDLQGILRAAIANFRAGRVVQGGSTITQQVAKSLLLTPERSFFRKMREVILANRMEKNLSKKEIIFLYLNQIYLGQGAYGIEAASKVYFNKPAKDITLAEAAILAGLPQAPSKYSPLSNPKMAKQRQLYVLRRMMEDGAITQAQMEESAKQEIKIYFSQDANEKIAPYYAEFIRKHLLEKYGKEKLYQSGLTVRTPIDPKLSVVATHAVQEGLRGVDKRQGYRGAMKRVKAPEEVEKTLAELSEYNLAKKYPYKFLTTDGGHALPKSEAEVFDENEVYQGLVTSVDDAKKEVSVNLGLMKGVIPLEKMKWAQLVKTPSSTGTELIVRPSQALAKGDHIWVRLVNKSGPITKGGPAVLALEQTPMVQGALISMDVLTGEVLSMVGGYDFQESEFNRSVQAERQPGSAYKPIIYAAAVDKGYTPSTIIQDSPIVFNAGENEKWKPENYEEKFYGDTLFRSALIHSRNIPTIKIVQDIQVPYLIDYSKRLGLPDKFNADLSIALGSSTISPLELVRVYAVFPRGGRQLKPLFIHKVVDREGKTLEENIPTPTQPPLTMNLPPHSKAVRVAGELQTEHNAGTADLTRGTWAGDPSDPDRVMDPRTAYVLTHLMNEVTLYGTAHGAKDLGRPAAGKTGTTNDYLDAWFIGFTPQVVTGVWVGFDAQKSLGPRSAGASTALPIWLEYMKEAVKPYPVVDFEVPKGVNLVFVHSKTGQPLNANNPNAVREAFIEGTEPGTVSGGGGNQYRPVINAGSGSPISPSKGPAGGPSDSDDFFKEDIQ